MRVKETNKGKYKGGNTKGSGVIDSYCIFIKDSRPLCISPNEASATTNFDPWNVQATGPSNSAEGDPYQLNLSINPSASAPAFGQFTVDWGDGSTPSTYTLDQLPATHTFLTGIDSTIISVTATTASGVTPALTVTADPIEVDMIPAAPANVQAIVFSATETDLTWTDVSQDADGYDILRSLDNGATFQDIAEVGRTDTSYSDTTQTAGETPEYEVQAVGDSTANASAATLATPPVSTPSTPVVTIPSGQPTLSATQYGSNGATLTWTYQGTDDSGFELEMLHEEAGENFHLIDTPGKVDGSGTGTETLTGLVAGDTYDFRIRADHVGSTASRYSAAELTIGTPILPSADASTSIIETTAPTGYPDVYDYQFVTLLTWNNMPAGGVQVEVRGDPYAGNAWHTVDNGSNGWWPTTFKRNGASPQVETQAEQNAQGYLLDAGVIFQGGAYEYRIRGQDISGNVTAWSNIMNIFRTADYYTGETLPSTAGQPLSFTATDTTITVTGQIVVPWGDKSIYDLLMQPLNSAGYDAVIDQPGLDSVAVATGGFDNSASNQDVIKTINVTIPNLTPGMQYDFCLFTRAGNPAGLSATLPGFYDEVDTISNGGTIATGNQIAAPSAPDKVWAVDLGDGVSSANIELLWHNSSNNEDGYIIQESYDPNFLSQVFQSQVGADQTNYIDSIPYYRSFIASSVSYGISPPLYYRVAAFLGNVRSAWVNVNITPSRSPMAMAISWIGDIPANNIEDGLLDVVTNTAPPYQFFPTGDGPQVYSLESWEALEDYRDILSVQVGYSVDPYTGKLTGVQPNIQQSGGYTPLTNYVHVTGGAELTSSGPAFNADHTSATITVTGKFRLHALEQGGFWLLHGVTGHWPHGAAWAWATITYTVYADGSFPTIVFSGSSVPNQTDYLDEKSGAGSYLMTSPGVDAFIAAPYGALGPVGNR